MANPIDPLCASTAYPHLQALQQLEPLYVPPSVTVRGSNILMPSFSSGEHRRSAGHCPRLSSVSREKPGSGLPAPLSEAMRMSAWRVDVVKGQIGRLEIKPARQHTAIGQSSAGDVTPGSDSVPLC